MTDLFFFPILLSKHKWKDLKGKIKLLAWRFFKMMLFHLLPSSSLPTLLFISECLFFGACFRRAKDNLSRAVNSKSHSGTPTLRKALHWPPLWIRVIAEGKWPILTLHCGLPVNSYTALRFKTTFPKALEKKLLWSLKIYNFNNNNWKVLKGDWWFFF